MLPCLRIYTCQKLFAEEKSKNQYDHRLQSNDYMSHYDRGEVNGQALLTVPLVSLHILLELYCHTTLCLDICFLPAFQVNLFYSQEYFLVRWVSSVFVWIFVFNGCQQMDCTFSLMQLAVQKWHTSPLMKMSMTCHLICYFK